MKAAPTRGWDCGASGWVLVDLVIDAETGTVSWTVRAVALPEGDGPQDLWVDGSGRLTVDPVADAERLPGRFVLPGLVDAHAHPSAGPGSAGPVALAPSQALAALNGWAEVGVCLVRDLGSPGGMTLDFDLEPGMPRVTAAGRFLAPAGRYFPELLPEGAGQEQLIALALGELARGARWVKVIADFPLLEDGAPTGPALATYAMEAIAHLVTAVHAAGGRVATHSTTDTVTDLVRVGVDSIEHGTGMDEATLRLMAGTGAAWTPTLCAVLSLADDAPLARRRQVAERRQRFRELLPLARRLGVPIMTGTDVVGTIAHEVSLLAELGLEPVDALAAATTVAHRFLGDKDDEHAGRGPASLVTYDADPREDLAILATPRAVLVNGVRIL